MGSSGGQGDQSDPRGSIKGADSSLANNIRGGQMPLDLQNFNKNVRVEVETTGG